MSPGQEVKRKKVFMFNYERHTANLIYTLDYNDSSKVVQFGVFEFGHILMFLVKDFFKDFCC